MDIIFVLSSEERSYIFVSENRNKIEKHENAI